jgi:hypothetical protein
VINASARIAASPHRRIAASPEVVFPYFTARY